MSERGDVNGYTCDTCGRHTYLVHVDEGVTPMFLACRAEGVEPNQASCKGRGISLMYPAPPVPAHVLALIQWEWYQPRSGELNQLRRREPDVYEHVRKGGALLRKLTDDGRAVIRELADQLEAA